MAGAILSYQNFVDLDTTTVTAPSGTSIDSNSDVTNVQARRLGKKTVFTSDDNEQIKFNFGSQKTFSLVVAIAHNMDSNGQWKIETSDDDFSTTKTDTGFLSAWNTSDTDVDQAIAQHQFSSDQTAQYVRITFDNTGLSGGQIKVGRVIIDDPYEPSINPSYGLTIRYVDPTKRKYSRGGVPWFSTRPKRRLFEMEFEKLGSGAEDELFDNDIELNRSLGISGDVYFSLDPSDTTKKFYHQSIYGTLKEPQPNEFVRHNQFSTSYSIEEAE